LTKYSTILDNEGTGGLPIGAFGGTPGM
jgi:hypothetical protein